MPDKRIELKVGGMTCAMCAKTITNSLKRLDGVKSADVNLALETATVEYVPGSVEAGEIRKAIENAGYRFIGVENEDSIITSSGLGWGNETHGVNGLQQNGPNENFPAGTGNESTSEDLKTKKKMILIGFTTGIFLMLLMHVPVEFSFPVSYLMLVISTPVFSYISYPIFLGAKKSLKNRNLNMDVMYSMGIGTAFVSSVLGTFKIGLSEDFMFYETAVFLSTFLTMGRYLEARAKGKTSKAIRNLMELQPANAVVVRNGSEIKVPIGDVEKGDIVIIKPGDRIPVDGIVLRGESYVDESMITGEPVPARKTKEDEVVSGTINDNSVLQIQAAKVGKDTVLQQIIRVVKKAQSSRPKVERLADRVVGYFIPVVLLIAIITFIGWYFIANETMLFSITALISVLVIACPCALGLATPTAVTVGVGRGAELGVLIRKGSVLENAGKLDIVIFDKTGTLTRGKPEVTNVIPINRNHREILELTATIEKNSTHPIAKAIVKKAEKEGVELQEVKNFQNHSGLGVTGLIHNEKLVVGNKSFIHKQNPDLVFPEYISEEIVELESQGKSVVVVGADSQLIGLFGIADNLKKDSAKAVNRFKNMGLEVAMITGDNKKTAEAVGKMCGINNVMAGVMPTDKAREVEKLQKTGKKVAFVGDGINDAPALAQADVGIAMGNGTHVAVESGDIVLMKDNLLDALTAVSLSKKVMSRIKQNLFWAFAYNTALIPMSAGILHPFFGITFKPELAGLAMALSSVTVISLSLLLKKFNPKLNHVEP